MSVGLLLAYDGCTVGRAAPGRGLLSLDCDQRTEGPQDKRDRGERGTNCGRK